jgi:hypothetical protein
MKVFVKTFDNITLSFDLQPSDTVKTLKSQIENAMGLSPDSQRLRFRGHLLDEKLTLSYYNIENESLILMMSRPRGWTTNQPTLIHNEQD